MKNIRTLSVIGSAIATWSNSVTANAEARKALLVQCAALALVEKQRIDAELVNYYAKQAGVGVLPAKRVHAYHAAFVMERVEGKTEAANMALSRARAVLYAEEKGEKAPSTPQATTPAGKVSATVLRFVKAVDGGKLAGDDRKAIRHAAQALLALL